MPVNYMYLLPFSIIILKLRFYNFLSINFRSTLLQLLKFCPTREMIAHLKQRRKSSVDPELLSTIPNTSLNGLKTYANIGEEIMNNICSILSCSVADTCLREYLIIFIDFHISVAVSILAWILTWVLSLKYTTLKLI